MSRSILLVVLLSLLPGPATAIVIRHDRDDTLYRELGDGFDFVCEVNHAMGTLVDPQWVLTAAHVAEPLGPGDTLRIGEREIGIADVFVHPDYGFADTHRDLALVRLSASVDGVRPAVLYEEMDEVGQPITLVGRGETGNGNTGPTVRDGEMRAAHNVVDAARPGWLTFEFDAPPSGAALEGISGPGDSGGPALLAVGDGWAIVGVSAFNDGEAPCTYGTIEHYCRVSDNLEWIRGIMSGAIVPSREPTVMVHGTDELGRATVSREVAAPVEFDASTLGPMHQLAGELAVALNQDDRDGYLACFSPACIERQEKAGDPVVGMFDFFEGAREARGRIIGFHELPAAGMKIPESEFPMRPVVFHLADGTSGYFGLAMNDLGRLDHLSLFVQSSICRGGASCDKMVLDLD